MPVKKAGKGKKGPKQQRPPVSLVGSLLVHHPLCARQG